MLCFGAGVGGVGAQGRAAAVSAGEATVLYQLHTELSERLVFRRSPFHARTGPARTAAWHFFFCAWGSFHRLPTNATID
jgi:hypothetical protein